MKVDDCICDGLNEYYECYQEPKMSLFTCKCHSSSCVGSRSEAVSYHQVFVYEEMSRCCPTQINTEVSILPSFYCFLRENHYRLDQIPDQRRHLRCRVDRRAPNITICIIDELETSQRLGVGYIVTKNVWKFENSDNALNIQNDGNCLEDTLVEREPELIQNPVNQSPDISIPNILERLSTNHDHTTAPVQITVEEKVLSTSDDHIFESSSMKGIITESTALSIEASTPPYFTDITTKTLSFTREPSKGTYLSSTTDDSLVLSGSKEQTASTSLSFENDQNQSITSSPTNHEPRNHSDKTISYRGSSDQNTELSTDGSKIINLQPESESLNSFESESIWLLALAALVFMIFILIGVVYCLLKNKRRRSANVMDPN